MSTFSGKDQGQSWINLGHIIDIKDAPRYTFPPPNKAKLPSGIKSIDVTINQLLPSTTILVCKFTFKDDLACSIETPLRHIYSTYKEKTKTGYKYHNVSNQKKDAVILARKHLKDLCSSWLADNFPGLFSAGYLDGKFPICEIITLKKHTPFEKIDDSSHDNFLFMLDLARDFYEWKSGELDGIFLQLREGRTNQTNGLVLSGNINNMLANKDLSGYGGGGTNKGKILHYLNYLDKSLSIWVLFVLAKAFERQFAKLRDSYGVYDINNTKNISSILMKLDREMLDIQKNTVPFIQELRDFCKQKKHFMIDVYEFKASKEGSKTSDGFFNLIRESLLFNANILDKNERILRNTADSNRQIAIARSSNNLALTNIKLQKRLNLMTLVMLLLTALLAYSAIPETRQFIDLKIIFEWFAKLIKLIPH